MAIENIDDCDLVGPRCENLIVKAEETLGFKFPRDLRQFITDFGAGAIGASEVYGVIDNNPEGAGPPDGVWMTLDARTGWPLPAEFFVLYFDGFEYYYVIDCKSSEDPPILAWIPGETKNSKEAVVSHDSFGELLEELASWIKE
nr:SMI1/KNR4 family protein [Austwickia sp. TVS 96-490-7B]